MPRSRPHRILRTGVGYAFYTTGGLVFLIWLVLFAFWLTKAALPAISCFADQATKLTAVTEIWGCISQLDFEPVTTTLFWLVTVAMAVGRRFVQKQTSSAMAGGQPNERQIVISQLRRDYVDNWLESKLGDLPYIELEKDSTPELVRRNSDTLFKRHYKITPNAPLDEIFDATPGGWLLVYGEPGAGKTTTLLKLLDRLLQKAEKDDAQPLPVFLSLGAWSGTQPTFRDWLADETSKFYSISKATVNSWIDNGNLILILDALDEVRDQPSRQACIESINTFRQQNATPIVLSTRADEYRHLTRKFNASNAILLKPLKREAIEALLAGMGKDGERTLMLLEHAPKLMELASRPMFLSMMLLPKTVAHLEMLPKDATERVVATFLFAEYLRERLVGDGTSGNLYSPEAAICYLHNIARWSYSDKFMLEFLFEEDKKTRRAFSKFEQAMPEYSYYLGESVTSLLIPSMFWLAPNSVAASVIWLHARILRWFPRLLFVAALLGLSLGVLVATYLSSRYSGDEPIASRQLIELLAVPVLGMLSLIPSFYLSTMLRARAKLKIGLMAPLRFTTNNRLDVADVLIYTAIAISPFSGILVILLDTGNRQELTWLTIYMMILTLVICLGWVWSIFVEPLILRAWLHFSGKLPWNSVAFVEYCVSRRLIHRIGTQYTFMHPKLAFTLMIFEPLSLISGPHTPDEPYRFAEDDPLTQ